MPVYDERPEWTATYSFYLNEATAATLTPIIPCPAGKRPHFREVSLSVATALVNASDDTVLEIGYDTDTDAYLDEALLAANNTLNATFSSSDTSGVWASALLDSYGEKDEDVHITLTPGAASAGEWHLFVTITWV